MSSSIRPRVRTPQPQEVTTEYKVYKGNVTGSQILSLESILGPTGRTSLEQVLNNERSWQKSRTSVYSKVITEIPQQLRNTGVNKIELQVSLQGNASRVETRTQFETRDEQKVQTLQEQ